MTLEEVIVELRARATQSVPFAGMAIGELKRGPAYQAAKTETLGVPVFWSGGKLRTASIDIARRLGVEDKVTPAKTDQQAAEPALPSEAVEAKASALAPAKAKTAEKEALLKAAAKSAQAAPARLRKTPAPKARAADPARRQSRSAQTVG
jgi:hypothetical protein